MAMLLDETALIDLPEAAMVPKGMNSIPMEQHFASCSGSQ